ncbi:YifB family Mg chelatase-like AAA ATPase [Massilia sp. PWRC2]|uniref:YifB family Mg chelatase-like AAA ATPase n=1 Tax=Massilia sp. PWRC2 TaxID=2804626 RepID=UPI003CF2D226
MGLAVLRSRALAGMDAPAVSVEVHLAKGLPSFTIVGLADTEVRESKDRVRAALATAGFKVPSRRVTVNLAPADLPKESGRFDLPIALGILAASGQLPGKELDQYEFAGELSLSGQLRPIRGALAMTFAMHRSDPAPRAFMLPSANADEAALVASAHIYAVDSLLQVCAHFAGGDRAARIGRHHSSAAILPSPGPDFADVKGQPQAKRALEVAAAGAHNVLMMGPPGTGKTMLASRFAGLLPPMTDDDALEAAAVQSLTRGFSVASWKVRPYRSPHHTTSAVALVGGGPIPRPGEISLAHCGVLFLDELPEFDRRVLEVLRQPLESGMVTISRAAHQADFPARFQLIAAMNPCPCGYLGHASGKCHCSAELVARYRHKISGPLLDRIDLQVDVATLDPDLVAGPSSGEASAVIAARVAEAATRQRQRQGCSNQQLAPRQVEQYCQLDVSGARLLRDTMAQWHWSARGYHRVLKVARTIADLAGSERIARGHVAEAIGYRRTLQEQ